MARVKFKKLCTFGSARTIALCYNNPHPLETVRGWVKKVVLIMQFYVIALTVAKVRKTKAM